MRGRLLGSLLGRSLFSNHKRIFMSHSRMRQRLGNDLPNSWVLLYSLAFGRFNLKRRWLRIYKGNMGGAQLFVGEHIGC